VASVKILDHTYALPVIVTERFRVLQHQVHEQQQVVQTGLRWQPRLLGIIPRAPRTLTPEERWQELDRLVRNYDAIIAELRVSQEAYEAFFGQIAAGVQQALARQWEAMQREEEERLADAQHPGTQQDETLQRLVHEDGERLMQGVRLLGQAALLLLKKIALCQEGLARLVSDQDLQRRVLTELTGRLELHRRAYLRRQRIARLVQDAARAGATGDYCFGDDVTQLSQYAWYKENAQGTTHPVGQLQPNNWGVYDLHGNVSEWVQDWYNATEYQRRIAAGPAAVDPAGPAAGSYRVARGGSWRSTARRCRSAFRFYDAPDKRRTSLGFRLLRMV
jgi:hypothetical protein